MAPPAEPERVPDPHEERFPDLSEDPGAAAQAEIEDILREATRSVRWAAPEKPTDAEEAAPPAGGPRMLPPLRVVRESGDIQFDIDRRKQEVFVAEAKPGIHVSRGAMVAIGFGVLVALAWFGLIMAWTAPQPIKLDPVYAEASLRHAMAITIRRIDLFQHQYERVPNTLTEIGPQSWVAITYEPIDVMRYRITAAGPNNPVEYDSIQSRESFLGNSSEFLRSVAGATP